VNLLKRINPLLAVIAAIAIVVALVWVVIPHSGKKYVIADFPRTISVYQGSDVKILGVHVGSVDSVTPMGTFVRVKFSYDDKYKVPANAKAAVISPSIVGDRFIQLTPAYRGGATLPNNAHLGTDRTATPLELDQIFGNLNELDVALGPKGANAPDKNGVGALTRLLNNTAANFGGQGTKFNQTIKSVSKLTGTLADNKQQLFGASTEIEKFINTLSKNDGTVRKFAQSLASGSALLADDRQALGTALDNLSVALTDVRGFVHGNRKLLTRNIAGLTRISNTIVKNRGALDKTLKYGPVALNNLALAYDPNTGTLDTRAAFGESVQQLTTNPGVLLCAVLGGIIGNENCPFASIGGKPAKSTDKASARSGVSPRAAALEGATSRDTSEPVDGFDPTLAGLVAVKR